MSIFLFILLIIIILNVVLNKDIKFRNYCIISPLILFILFIMPSNFMILINYISCRKINNNYFVYADLLTELNTNNYF